MHKLNTIFMKIVMELKMISFYNLSLTFWFTFQRVRIFDLFVFLPMIIN
jgi:hypothetical protein